MIFSIADQASRSRAFPAAFWIPASAFAFLLAPDFPLPLGRSRTAPTSRPTSMRSYQISISRFAAKPAMAWR